MIAFFTNLYWVYQKVQHILEALRFDFCLVFQTFNKFDFGLAFFRKLDLSRLFKKQFKRTWDKSYTPHIPFFFVWVIKHFPLITNVALQVHN